jgi:thymidylate synthase (FAD)
MKIIEPSATIIHVSGDIQTIERAARTCYKSEDRIKDDGSSAKKLVSHLVDRNHTAMLEFVDITVRFITDRAIANEIVRHRLASYAQESTRYVNYKEGVEFIEPLFIAERDKSWLPYTPFKNQFRTECEEAEQAYNHFLELGATPQDARAILPLCLKTELVMKANLRSWLNFFELRTAPAAHPEMRRITIPLCNEFKKTIPIVFDDFVFE